MDDLLVPQKTVTFTLKRTPTRPADRKTIQRLMRMQPDIRKGLKGLQKRRRQHDNRPYIRAGVWWIDRAKATRLVRAEAGESFTLELTPQVIPDLQSVSRYLDAKTAG